MVPGLRRFLLPIISLWALSGCAALGGLFSSGGSSGSSAATAAAPAAGAATESVPSIIDEVEPSTRLAMFSPSALLDGSASMDRIIVDSQCRFRSADPPFLVPTSVANKNWTFTGRIEKANAKQPGEDAQALEYRSWFGFGSGKQQLNSWPVSMVTLSEMPKAYLDDRLTMLSDHTYQVNKAQTDALTTGYINDSQKIQDRVQILVSSFDPAKCPTE